MKVFLNNVELAYNLDWTYTGNGSIVRLKTRVKQQDGDILNVYITSDGQYRYGYFDSSNEFCTQLRVHCILTVHITKAMLLQYINLEP